MMADAIDPKGKKSDDETPTIQAVPLTPEQVQARKKRSQWTAIALFAFVILIFVITMTKLGANVLVRDL